MLDFEEQLTHRLIVALVTPLGLTSFIGLANAESAKLNTQRIEQLTGLKGKLDEKERVFKVSMPRKDLNLTAAGVKVTPALGLTAWAAFTKTGEHTMVMRRYGR